MNNPLSIHTRKTLTMAAAAALVMGLAACDQDMSAEKVGRKIDNTVDQTGQQIARATDSAEKKMEQAGSAISEKTAQAGDTLQDAAITAKVKSALVAEPGLNALSIDVDTENGVVSLFGSADTQANRERATQLASAVEGVKSVQNKLVIVQGS